MSSRRVFSRMAQIAILIILIVLAFFLIRGFARSEQQGSYHRGKYSERIRVLDASQPNLLMGLNENFLKFLI